MTVDSDRAELDYLARHHLRGNVALRTWLLNSGNATMQQIIRSLVAALATLLAVSVATPASAVVVVPNPADFSISESPGQYTVFNNSTDWYIYAFAVSNPNAANSGASASTTFTNWSGFIANLDLGSGPTPVFAYATGDADLSDLNNVTLTNFNLANYIGPGSSSSLFYFSPGIPASDYGMLLVNADELTSQVNGSSATPLPGALPLFTTGLGALGFLGWRRKKKATALAA